MAVLVCHAYPYLKIYNAVTGDYAQFQGGKLEVEPGDPNYEVAMAEAASNPAIQVLTKTLSCELCGADFGDGKVAHLNLGKHVKEVHFEVWQRDREAEHAAVMAHEVKAREGFACDVCRPAQTFGTEEDLRLHNDTLHMAAPAMDEEGNTVGGEEPAVVTTATTIPAAKKK